MAPVDDPWDRMAIRYNDEIVECIVKERSRYKKKLWNRNGANRFEKNMFISGLLLRLHNFEAQVWNNLTARYSSLNIFVQTVVAIHITLLFFC
jgi:hypothetical protein